MDIDCVPDSADTNLDRLADALRELGGRLRVGGLSDDEARQLKVQRDGTTLASFGSSTWMTDAGAIDILGELRGRDGGEVGALLDRCDCARTAGDPGRAGLDVLGHRQPDLWDG